MSSDGHRTVVGPKPTKACVNCRRQKMKCEVEHGTVCKRCKTNKTECIFKPRANAAAIPASESGQSITLSTELGNLQPGETTASVLSRLAVIESILGIDAQSPSNTLGDDSLVDFNTSDTALDGLLEATANLRRFTGPQNTKIWSPSVVKQLWLSFYSNMEGLHFQSEREAAENPTPLLLASILYVSALHHNSDQMAALAPLYFRATCSAIAELSIPSSLKTSGLRVAVDKEKPFVPAEQVAFQDVLGLILAGLVSEAFIDLTGIWISIGYRLTLDHCPVWIDERSSKWRQLFSGLQIIDLEHASLHLSCPIIPIKAPLTSLRQLQRFVEDPFNRLTEMMHVGLSHFTGRGLPTIWSFISSNDLERHTLPVFPFTDTDTKVIREWAKNLDDWLSSSNKPTNSETDRIQIIRQYSLHRLFVLSIYHPARGFDLFANNVASMERHELLFSARTTLRLHNNDKGIWANWDLVIITWAAILVLQAAEGGMGEHGDLLLVQTHLNILQRTHRPSPSLHHTLANRLESWLQSMNTPPAIDPDLAQMEIDPSWTIFDENSNRLATESFFQQLDVEQNSTLGVGDLNAMTDNTLGVDNIQPFENGKPWSGHEHLVDSWPSNLLRLFGTSEFPTSTNDTRNLT